MRLLVSNVLLGLAWFGASNIAASLVAWMAGKRALGRVDRPRAAALLAIRLLPSIASLAFVTGVFLPSHWLYEPVESQEVFGLVLSLLAACGAIVLGRSIVRALRAMWNGYQAAALVQEACHPIEGGVFEVGGLRGVSLAGIFRPRILIGSEALAALTPAELDVAVSHERAHRQSRDNLKRFLICCAPDVFGWTSIARALEEQWQTETECQADAFAVRGNDERAVTLASALVKVAQLTSRPRIELSSPAWSAFHVPTLLETRVRRLVAGRVGSPNGSNRIWIAMAASVVAMPAAVWIFDVSYTIHQITEALVARIP